MQSIGSGLGDGRSTVLPAPSTAPDAGGTTPNNAPPANLAATTNHPSSSSTTPVPPKPSDFKFGRELGSGSFSTVYVAKEISTQKEYAIKVVIKEHVYRNKAILSVLMEKEVLKRTNHPLLIRLYYTFQDQHRLYYVLQYAQRGHLLTYLNKLTSFNREGTQFYSAELLLALEYLHSQSIVHRDVKPENVLLSLDMHIKLADFGSAIILNDPSVKAPTFTGTPQYVSPEMLQIDSPSSVSSSASSSEDECDKKPPGGLKDSADRAPARSEDSPDKGKKPTALVYLMDYWAFGCVIYQMLSGRPPFRPDKHGHEFDVFRKVLALDYVFPERFDNEAKDIVQRLLVASPSDRLGGPTSGGPTAVRSHPFFAGVEWDSLMQKQPPTLIPNLEPLEHNDWDKVPAGYTEGQKYLLSQELKLAASQVTEIDRAELLKKQANENIFHRFVRGRLIVKQGVLYKRRGLFARKRVFLLTEGPHLFYVDPETMVRKGEVPWSSFLRVEVRNSKIFSIIVPNRIYYLEDPAGHANDWLEKLRQVKAMYYSDPIDN
ncbi:3-phosphoinositide dependent protein kinase-1 [Sparganum proliferum]